MNALIRCLTMTNKFEFNAPQFVDFNAGLDDSDGADTFFDVEHEDTHQNCDVNKENNQKTSKSDIEHEDTHQNCDENKENITKMTKSGTTPIKQIDTHQDDNKTCGQEEAVEINKSQEKKVDSSNKRGKLKAVRRLSGINNELLINKKPFAKSAENLSEDLLKLSVKAKKRSYFDGISILVKEEKKHGMTTRKDEAAKTPRLELRTRVVNKEEPAIESRKRKALYEAKGLPGKYMALAESILHFQKDTPPRFHSSRRTSVGHGSLLKARQSYNPRRTIALTPKLLTSQRSRPVDIPSQEQKEVLELEEMKKHQIHALPLSQTIFKPPKPLNKSEKPRTVPEPFNLTKVFKKPQAHMRGEPYKFTAKPAPKTIFEKPVGLGPKTEIPITVPQSPAITKSARFQKPMRIAAFSEDNKESSAELYNFGVPLAQQTAPKKTEIKPFSFEQRDKELMEKKERKIREILEAEKKAREFKANPLPHFDQPKEINRSSRSTHLDCSKSSIVSSVDEVKPFKARSPRVLRKPKFEPKLDHTHSEPLDIQLHTEQRAIDRQEFDLKQLEKEEQLACLREQMEMEKKKDEEAKIAKLRQDSVHKAQPMPVFKPVAKVIKSEIPLTDPKSPRFSKRTRTNTLCSTSQVN